MQFRRVRRDDQDHIERLLARRSGADQRDALTEYKVAKRRSGEAIEVVAVDSQGIAGYAIAAQHGDGGYGIELVPRPGTAEVQVAVGLMRQLCASLPPETSGYVWAWRDADITAAEAMDFMRTRRLITMERWLDESDDLDPVVPAGFRLRRFVVGEDEAAWVRVNRRAFAHHPETSAIDEADLRRRQSEDWFDPAGFILAVDDADEVVGYCWTKLHPGSLGEIYIIGVVPEVRGSGLGRALLDAGLADLHRRQGAGRVQLYMDGDDAKLTDFYAANGFTRTFETFAYELVCQPKR